MGLAGNIIWFLLGGFFIAFEYLVSSVLLMVTIIGIPFGIQTLKLAHLALWPFGKEVEETKSAGGCLQVIMNVLWLFLGGLCIVISHLVLGAILFITIIGIPFARQHFKLARLALTPFDKRVV